MDNRLNKLMAVTGGAGRRGRIQLSAGLEHPWVRVLGDDATAATGTGAA
jgi:hypothetical protein